MRSIDSPRPFRTLSAMYTPPSIDIEVPDTQAANGSLQYTIRQAKGENGYSSYGLYFDGHRVPSPQFVINTFSDIFAQHLSPLDPSVVAHICNDLSISLPEEASTAAQIHVAAATPPPHRVVPRKPYVVTLDDGFSWNSFERKTPKLQEAILLEDNMEEAERQIRQFLIDGKIQAIELPDKSGYYTNIVHTVTRQVHQVGFSAKKNAPWHVVFQLSEGINPTKGPYNVPIPHISQGRVQFPGLEDNPAMNLMYQKPYNSDDAISKLLIRDLLGKLDEESKRFCFGVAPISTPTQPANMRRFYGDPPWWLKKALPHLRESAHPPYQTPLANSSHRVDGFTQRVSSSGVSAPIPLLSRRVGRAQPQPGELGWRVHDLVDTSLFPSNVENAGVSLSYLDNLIPYVPQTTAPRAQELGWDEHGLPRKKKISRPLHDDSAVNLHLPPVAPSTYSPKRHVQPEAAQKPATSSPYQLVNFGGYSDIHTSYSFI